MRYLNIVAMSTLIGMPNAYAEVVDIKWTTDGQFVHSEAVAAGKFLEVCGKLPAGLKVNWEFDASTPVDFNVHYHVAKEVSYPAKLTAVATGKDILITKTEEDYCWMWTNKSPAPATVTTKFKR